MKVYFDNAATTKVRDEVVAEISNVLKNCFGNPSSSHSYGRSAKSYIETSRKSIAKILNCEPGEIIFNSGGTESDNSILKCAVKDLGVKHIISSKIEHHAITHTLEDIENKDLKVHYVNLKDEGEIDIDNLESILKLNNEPKLVSLMYINNEIGNILDIKSVSNLCRKYNAYFHSDAVQAIGHYPIDLSSLDIDFISSAGHKFHGPKGIGFTYINKSTKIKSFICGGPQERGLRAGTESVHNIVGMTKALEISIQNLDKEKQHVKSIKRYMIEKLNNLFPDIHYNGTSGDLEKSTYTILNVCLPISNDKASMLDFHLDLRGIACSKGSACQSGSSIGSHVLNEIQSAKNKKLPSIRFSFSHNNSVEEVDYLIETLQEFINS
ncbi:MAG: cysteine desulfurase family protein [Bacteroidetes bacterium]|nr:cysteine desulfurase family protein [Bacteroidota bacterium]MDA0885523.1 cysteine desulfurase family protein [Bacteroidota bacterium]MDA1225575.1 cysteine desulfurase family protein [Bacteroidota bacterium]